MTVIAKLQAAGRDLSRELLHPDYQDTAQRAWPRAGLCYPLSEALWWLFPDCFTPYWLGWEDGGSHWFLTDSAGALYDLVSYPELLCAQEDYEAAQHRPF